MSTKKVVMAGGGSGGHMYPLLSVARELKRCDSSLDISFVTVAGSVDEKIIPRENFPFRLIPSGKMKGRNPFQLLTSVFKIVYGLFYCAGLVLRERPLFVFSAGGYAGAPYIMAASLLGVPCAILEQNRWPGLANRLMSFFCKIIFVNFAGTKDALKDSKKEVIVVGHPCRPEIEAERWSAEEAERRWREPVLRIFIFGGSQGALGINRLVTAALPHLGDYKNKFSFLHQTGEADYENVRAGYRAAGITEGKVEKYVFDMASAYRDAHLVICRAGASSIAELAAAGKAALLIPLVSKDRHQEFNAEEMKNLGAADCRLQRDLTGESLAALWKEVYDDRSKLQRLSQTIVKFHQADASQRVAAELVKAFNVKK